VFVTEAHCPFCLVLLAPMREAPVFKLNARMSRAQRCARGRARGFDRL
jgi:hypothetical protein